MNFLQELSAPVFKMMAILMKAASICAFGVVAFVIGKYGISSIGNLIMLDKQKLDDALNGRGNTDFSAYI